MVAEHSPADQAEHYDEMAEYTQRVGAQPVEFSVERRNPRSVADKNAVGSRRAARRVVTSVEQKEKIKGREKQADDARERTFALDDYDELIPEWLNFIKGSKDSEEIPLNICRETLLQNKIMRVTKKNQVKKRLEMLAEITEQKDDCEMFYKQIGRRLKLGIHEDSTVGVKTAELLMINTSKSGGEEISLKEYAERIEEEQNDICYTNDESITVVSSLLEENLRKNGHEVLYMVDPLDEYAVHQFKEFGGKMLKSTTKEGLDLGDEEEKNKIEELKAEFKPLTKLIKEVLGDNGECVPSTSEYGWSAKMERIMEAQGLRDSSMTSHMVSKKTPEEPKAKLEPLTKLMKDGLGPGGQDEEKAFEELNIEPELGGKVDVAARGQVDVERVRQHTAWQRQPHSSQQQPTRKKKGQVERERGQGERESGEKEQEEEKKETGEEEKEAEEGGDEQVEKDVTGWTEVTRKRRRKTAQIFVKVNGSKATPTEVSLTDDKVEDVMRQVQSDEDAYVTMQGKVLRRDEKLKSCGVTDGCTVQVTSRLRGGGRHKDKKSKVKKEQVTRQEPVRNEGLAVLESEKEADGLCAMVCEQMRWAMETVNTLQSTDEDKRRIAEEVEKVKKAMAGMEKQATGGDLQRVAEMEESLKKLEKEVQAKDVDNQKMTMNLAETGGKKDTREGRGCAGLVQGGDETHRMNETSGKGRGKGNGGKGEHGREGDEGGKGFQQQQETDEEAERVQVAPNMGAGGSHPQATTDPEEEAVEEERGRRKLSWADCDEKEEWKDDVEGGQQDRRKVVKKVTKGMREKRKDGEEVGQGSWSDEVDGEGQKKERQERGKGKDGKVQNTQKILKVQKNEKDEKTEQVQKVEKDGMVKKAQMLEEIFTIQKIEKDGKTEQVQKVEKDGMDKKVEERKKFQIYANVDGMKTVVMDMSPKDKIQKILKIASGGHWNVYATCEGRILRKDDDMESCGVRDGSTVQVTSRMRGGGRHKVKKSKAEKKRDRTPEMPEQTRQEHDEAQITPQEAWQEQFMEKQRRTQEARGDESREQEKQGSEEDDDERVPVVPNMEAGSSYLQTTEPRDEVEKIWMDEIEAIKTAALKIVMDELEEKRRAQDGKGKGKGEGGKGEHEGEGGFGGKGTAQTMKSEDEEEEVREEYECREVKFQRDLRRLEERRRAQEEYEQRFEKERMSENEDEDKHETRGTRRLRWADCEDDEIKEGERETKAEERKVTRPESGSEEQQPPGLEKEKGSEHEQEAHEEREAQEAREEQRRAQEARENLRTSQEAREEQRRAKEAREEQRRAQEAREEQRRAQEARENLRKAQEAREEEKRAQEAREEHRRVQEAREKEAKAQEERERLAREAKAQEERDRGVSAHEERREQDREAEAQGGARE